MNPTHAKRTKRMYLLGYDWVTFVRIHLHATGKKERNTDDVFCTRSSARTAGEKDIFFFAIARRVFLFRQLKAMSVTYFNRCDRPIRVCRFATGLARFALDDLSTNRNPSRICAIRGHDESDPALRFERSGLRIP